MPSRWWYIKKHPDIIIFRYDVIKNECTGQRNHIFYIKGVDEKLGLVMLLETVSYHITQNSYNLFSQKNTVDLYEGCSKGLWPDHEGAEKLEPFNAWEYIFIALNCEKYLTFWEQSNCAKKLIPSDKMVILFD